MKNLNQFYYVTNQITVNLGNRSATMPVESVMAPSELEEGITLCVEPFYWYLLFWVSYYHAFDHFDDLEHDRWTFTSKTFLRKFRFTDYIRLIIWLETWKLHGAKKFLFYASAISPSVAKVLDAYTKTVSWTLPNNIKKLNTPYCLLYHIFASREKLTFVSGRWCRDPIKPILTLVRIN